eukprot:CAMPEP_0203914804 /NCGR_PEP_ID=MMETSP0359-20131031/55661_1 /ASSEMBLY_ACC=CAM_ASM_000338 /TAXON_ID=268821 /ORGANISM="Scrippsiella Hangoei, Strain SHTV-5" /LENGTH=75 /DNA_ID=CAMNT_0050841181 /DNA_START=273 /DNA_END=497 /DNA_ORIENTATION=+
MHGNALPQGLRTHLARLPVKVFMPPIDVPMVISKISILALESGISMDSRDVQDRRPQSLCSSIPAPRPPEMTTIG